MARKKSRKNTSVQIIASIVIIGLVIIFGTNYKDVIKEYLDNIETYSLVDLEKDKSQVVNGNLIVDYIDVGQGDSILIRQGEHTMLIDGGTTECKNDLLNFLKNEKIEKFDYIIGTHYHEDHIGSLDDVVNSYDFNTIFFPHVTTTTKTFENLVLAVKEKNKTFVAPEVGKVYNLGDASFEILAPNNDKYSSANNYSIVIKLTYGNNSFLFTGDAETLSESEILDNNSNIKADVIKIGHHGSSTSTSDEFLKAVNPKYAVISVGKDNSYNHPNKTTMQKLKRLNIPVYRTDGQGTIECISDGTNISFNVNAGSYNFMGN